jgi:hypothetical protein
MRVPRTHARDRAAAVAAANDDGAMELQHDAELLSELEALFVESDSVVIAAFKVLVCVLFALA